MVKLHSGISRDESEDGEPKKVARKDWMIKAIKAGREKRNVKNVYKVMLIFTL